MKRIAYSFLFAAFISSCGPSHPLNAVRVQFEDSQWHDYYLLQNLDTAIIVYSRQKDSSEIIAFARMRKIALQGKTTVGEWLGALGGFLIASSIIPVKNSISNVVYPASLPIGWYIGHLLTDKWIEVDPYSLEARELLDSRSQYPETK